jgi:hypothetical protein
MFDDTNRKSSAVCWAPASQLLLAAGASLKSEESRVEQAV